MKLPKSAEEVGDGLLFQANPSKTKVFRDEKIILTYVAFTRFDVNYDGFENDGRLPHFWFEEFIAGLVPTQTMTLHDRKYVRAVIRKRALFPMEKGKFTVQPGTAKFNVLLHIPMKLRAAPVEIQVEDFPEPGKPESFTGSSGEYTMDAVMKKGSLAGEFVFVVTVQGEGNFWGLHLPEQDFGPDFKLLHREEKVTSKADWENDSVSGKKEFIFTLASQKTGEVKIKEIIFSYFNPGKEQYETLKTPEVPLNVEKAYDFSSVKTPDNRSAKSSVMILLDASGSMQALDFKLKDRLNTAKSAIKEMLSNSTADELVGVKSFSREVNAIANLSKVDGNFISQIDKVGINKQKDGSAIGSAIYEGTKDLKREGLGRNKKIILITDGSFNSGFMDPITAADFAAKENIQINAIAMGKEGKVPYPVNDPKGGTHIENVEISSDHETLEEIAEVTGGRFYKVEDEAQLLAALNEIRGNL